MPNHQAAFRNQRPRFWRLSPPYADKPVDSARGLFPSTKCGIQIHFWTWQELAFIKLLEAAPSVVRYDSRPHRVMLRDGPEWLAYVPHFTIDLSGRSVVAELSHQGKPASPGKERVASLARAHYREQDVGFAEIAHAVVRAGPRSQNANVLMRYLSVVPDQGDILRVHDCLWEGPRSIDQVAEQAGVSCGRIVAMLRIGELVLAETGRITPGTLVTIPGEETGA